VNRYGCVECEVLQSASFTPVCWCCGKPMIASALLPPLPWFRPFRFPQYPEVPRND
jgi:hypothetical protein